MPLISRAGSSLGPNRSTQACRPTDRDRVALCRSGASFDGNGSVRQVSATDRSTPPGDLPPVHVLAPFGLRAVEPEPLGSAWSRGWRCGDVVLTPVTDHARATWSAGVREPLKVEGGRLARPGRSTDGRWVASGWPPTPLWGGGPDPGPDGVVSVSPRLHHAMADLSRPRFLRAGPR